MVKTIQHLWIMLGLGAYLLGACNLPSTGSPTQPDTGSIATSAAQTVIAQLTEAAGPSVYYTQAAQTIEAGLILTPIEPNPTLQPAQATQASTNTPTSQPLVDTSTPEPSATSTITPSPTSSIPMITASEATNCRYGPSKVFDITGSLMPEDSVQVFGKDSTGFWWYIQNPDFPQGKCWVWTETTVVTGDISSLPVVQSPPTPTPTETPIPGFNVYFSNVHLCGGVPTAVFQVDNTGGWNLESISLQIDDLTASITLYGPASSDSPFMGSSSECPQGGETLKAGKTAYIGGAIGLVPPGHQARATMTICTENSLGGLCIQKTIDFVIP